MLDISKKSNTLRTAIATAVLKTSPHIIQLIKENKIPKGNPLEVAKIAAVQGAKNTSSIIPYCHPLPLSFVGVDFELLDKGEIKITATVNAIYKTGVEMEALTGVTIAALTLYDMIKMLDNDMEIINVKLLDKKGGKSDYKDNLNKKLKAAVLVMSDTVSKGTSEDLSGKLIVDRLIKEKFDVVDYKIIPDDTDVIEKSLINYADNMKLDIVLTTGGTGISKRDNTPEAMLRVIEKEIPGISEAIRAFGQERMPYSMLSRGKAGLRGNTLIINMPGSKGGVCDSLDVLFPVILHSFKPIGTKITPLSKSLGYVLSESIKSKYNVPLFDNSSVDGYGVRISDIKRTSANSPVKLKLVREIKAGDFSEYKLKRGEVLKIFTGAMVPKSVDAVVMKEYSVIKNGYVYLNKSVNKRENIRVEGEEFKKNSVILTKGTPLTPPILGLIASLGYSKIKVYIKPKVSIIITGSELVPPGAKLSKGKIYDSNSFAIAACLKELGVQNIRIIHVKDKKNKIKSEIKKALKSSDLIITIGGVSVGDYDFVKDVLKELKVKTFFTKVSMKPGKPNCFGVYRKKIIFGLPGNPVSALVSFHQFIRPALLKMMGANISDDLNLNAILSADLKKNSPRLEFIRGYLKQNNGSLIAYPTLGQGSHMLGGIANANCLIYFPQNKNFLKKGERVKVDLLSWTFR